MVEDKFVTLTSGIRLAYQTFGNRSDPVFLLITGWFSDLTLWPRGFCELLASRGFYVIRYDNRDSGLSTRTEIKVSPEHPPYSMSDWANDAILLLDKLGIEKAHIAGFAMGANIAHYVVIEHHERVMTLTAFATTSGAPGFSAPDPSIRTVFSEPHASDTEGLEIYHKKIFKAMASSSFDENDYEERHNESKQRGALPARVDIQSLVNRPGDRTKKLKMVKVPVLVVHGGQDPLISIEAARAHAAVFPDATLLVLNGIGHGVLPKLFWEKLATAMSQLAERVNYQN